VTRAALTAWLERREPPPPAALASRLARAVRETPEAWLAAHPGAADALSAIGLALLAEVAARGPQAPDLALDLLAADAFVTYAIEAAAEDGLSAGRFAARILSTATAE